MPSRIVGHRRRSVPTLTTPDRSYDRTRRNADATRFYHSVAWRRLRLIQLSRQPLCEHCLERFVATPASVADHRVPVLEAWDLRLDLSNLRSLCLPCHNRRHAK